VRWFASLRRHADFARVRRLGKRTNLRTLRAFVLPGRSAATRIGVSVPVSVGPAVVRNLVRRRVHGALSALPAGSRALGKPADVVFLLSPEAAQAGYAAVAQDVASVVAQFVRPGAASGRKET
jgi:ribonuclease P protein component